MSRRIRAIAPIILLLLLAACRNVAQTPEPTPTIPDELTPTETAEPTPRPTATAEPTPTVAATAVSPEVEPETEGPPKATIVNDEGGPVSISGEVTYTNAFFTLGVAEPVIILEDQAGFVDRNESFLMPPESQTLGQITSDFFTSPFS